MSKKQDINTLVRKMLMGEISQEEQADLHKRMEANLLLKQQIEELLDEEDFVDRYRRYQSIQLEKAKEKAYMMQGLASHKKAKWKMIRMMSAAAALALVIISGWMLFGKKSQPTPELAPEVAQAMKRVEKNGMAAATLVVPGNKPITVANATNAQTKIEQLEEEGVVPDNDNVTENMLFTKHDKEFWMVLDDGTYVHLNYNTRLTYPNRFIGSERRVKLEGEAYFVIAKDSYHRPFIVETAYGDVHDYGTEFNVSTLNEEKSTSVVLVKGSVGVSNKHGKEYLLQPGEMAKLQTGKTPDINKVDVSLYTSWNTGNFLFEGCSLRELMGVISHWYNMKVDFASEDIQQIQFTGSIDKYEPMVHTLHAIENITKLHISVDGNQINISKNKQ